MDDLAVLNRDDRDESVVIGCTTRNNPAVHFVLKDHDTTILSTMYNECIARVKLDRLPVSGKAGDQTGASSNRYSPTREVITGLEDRVIGKRVEIMFASHESAQAFQDNFEEWIQGFKGFVLGSRHHQLLSVPRRKTLNGLIAVSQRYPRSLMIQHCHHTRLSFQDGLELAVWESIRCTAGETSAPIASIALIMLICGSEATFIMKDSREMPPKTSLCRKILSTTSSGLPISSAPLGPRCASKLARVIGGQPRSLPTSVMAFA